MQVIAGVIFHFIGGFASGSFYIPYKKVKGWHWESFWIVGGIFSWFIVPPLAAYLTVPGFADIISGANASTLGITYLFGVLWGIGGLTYGLGVRYLGVSLGSEFRTPTVGGAALAPISTSGGYPTGLRPAS